MKWKDFFTSISGKDYDLAGTYKAIDVAKHIITKCSVDGKTISNLQLQKILYYTQKFFLQTQKKALFSDEIEAWKFGPVVKEVYDYFCGFGSIPIFYIQIGGSLLNDADAEFVDMVTEEKRKLNPWDMVDDTHQKGKAWYLVYQNGRGYKKIIPKRLIAENG